MFKAWSTELWRIALVVGPAWVTGALLGYPGWLVASALACLLVWHSIQLRRLLLWLTEGEARPPSKVNGIWAQVVDVTARLRNVNSKRERMLASWLARFRELTAAMPDAVIIIDAAARIEWINDAATQLLGLRPRQDTGQHLTDLLRDPVFTSYLTAEDYRDPIEFSSPLSRDLYLSARVVPYGQNQRLVTVRDVTRLYQLEAMRRDFVANVSHELRTPLTVITGYLETFSDDDCVKSSDLTAHTVQQMAEQAARMQRLIEDLLMLSRLETTIVAADEVRAVSVASLIVDIETEAHVLARTQRNRIVSQSDASLWLKGNAKELYSAFLNLVSNAIRYSPAGGDIMLRWYGDHQGAHFSVQDHGIGIEPQHIPRITERFYRVDKDRSRASGGTGLGLAIVKHVLQRHDAGLRIVSRPGHGSTFTCDFPPARIERRESNNPVIGA